MRVNRALPGRLLCGCACLFSFSLLGQTLLHPGAPGPQPLSSDQAGPKAENPLRTSDASILTDDAAFNFKAVVETRSVLLSWTIRNGYYLYQSKLEFTDSNGRHLTAKLPSATKMVDEFLGESLVYFDTLQVLLPLADKVENYPANYSVTVQYQGCAKDRYCYPPQTKTLSLSAP